MTPMFRNAGRRAAGGLAALALLASLAAPLVAFAQALTPIVEIPPWGIKSACKATPTPMASGARQPRTIPTSPVSSR